MAKQRNVIHQSSFFFFWIGVPWSTLHRAVLPVPTRRVMVDLGQDFGDAPTGCEIRFEGGTYSTPMSAYSDMGGRLREMTWMHLSWMPA